MAGGLHRGSEIAEFSAPAHISHDSDAERPTKVASRKHSIYTHFSKRPKLRSLVANQDYKGALQNANWKFSTWSREVFVLRKSSTKEWNLVTIINTQSWYRI